LHSGIVHNFHRALESGFKIESNPTRSKVSRFRLWTATKNRPRIAHGYHIIFPMPRALLDPATIALAVMAGPEKNFIGSRCPVAKIFTLVPPISIPSTFIIEVVVS
jgi:hypothetical protein